MAVRRYLEHFPRLGARAYVDPAASVIGAVELGEDASERPGAVLRGDVNFIRVGARTNLQDGCIVHVTHDGPLGPPGGVPTLIGDDVTIGHGAILHACSIGNACLVGMGAIVLDGAQVEDNAFVGAGAMVAPGKRVRSGELWLGSPAKCVRRLTPAEVDYFLYSAQHYVRLKDHYLAEAPG
jgi:carbonic anhydrase/acetyltransferase-like protein (isoleucine patch superfamily)